MTFVVPTVELAVNNICCPSSASEIPRHILVLTKCEISSILDGKRRMAALARRQLGDVAAENWKKWCSLIREPKKPLCLGTGKKPRRGPRPNRRKDIISLRSVSF